ncbi:hypothetical protein CRE_15003 [Caenorhabditis remanei]|uniref:Uncharacterized protein n=1 Tax=Caenorhabditis remanei TaxID=31234 RepID=E3NH98_CAERE|nr:hypothetical protein CRE_15003 [Caenorhabditis remanei]
MKRIQSELFAPYRFMGVVTGDASPSIRSTFVGKKATLSVLCPIDNVIVQYNGKKLRAIGMSDPLNDKITAVASSSSSVFAAAGNTISSLKFCREVSDSIDIGAPVKMMTLIGTQLVAIDVSSGIHVIETENDTFQMSLLMEGSDNCEITSICHPSTYLNKIVVGSNEGRLRIINIRTGKVIHEFQRNFGSAITILEQTTALDVLAIGMANGEVLLFNVKLDKVLSTFRHDAKITNIAFRDDGEAAMVTADQNGTIAVWDLEKQELIGKITGTHTNEINCLHFLAGEPIMLSASHDNSLRLWIFDSADGMPRELIRLEGHSKPCASVKFVSKNEVLSAGKDGSVRKYDVTSLTMRQKLGSVAQQKKGALPPNGNTEVQNVAEMAFGWQREAAWNNVFCRQVNDTKVTTWQTRNNTHGEFNLEHDRFKKKVDFIDATATALCVSPCGNFVYIGYSTGHIDQFNAQSGRHVHSFTNTAPSKSKKKDSKRRAPKKSFIMSNGSLVNDTPAADSAITSLSVDQLGKELMSTDEEGHMVFWSIATKKITARMFKKDVKLGISAPCPANSLVAVVSIAENGAESVILVDTVCHRVARAFETVGKKVNAITFSSDGKWLLVADNESYIRVFDVATSQLIDVLLFSKPCISMSYSETGQYLATVHEGERAIYTWFNKLLYAIHVNVKAHEPDYLPTWEGNEGDEIVDIDDEDEDDSTVMDLNLKSLKELQIDENLVTFSGLPSSRWANLPDLAMIKERNKPTDAPKKIKQAPFFLSAAATLDGFEFETENMEEEMNGDSSDIMSKRNLLELESSFTKVLRNANTKENLLAAFKTLQEMSLSAIDFQIRDLNPQTLPIFFRMLLEVLKTKNNFELVQAYAATALKTHRSIVWNATDEPEHQELSEVLEEMAKYQRDSWNEMENLFVENMAVVQWIKNALL